MGRLAGVTGLQVRLGKQPAATVLLVELEVDQAGWDHCGVRGALL
jgi:hypothetical protein